MSFISRKKLPCGVSDFELLKKENYYYVDKTKYIENIETSPRYLFFLRPRRFGKSLMLSVIEYYYDIEKKDDFEALFKDTYIYNNPTEERNKYFILKFNFSRVSSRIEEVEESFNEIIKLDGLKFLETYKDYLDDKEDKMYKTLEKLNNASSVLNHIIDFIKGRGKIYLLIDEYDNFTNTIISSVGNERYTAITHGEGFFRHFFNVIKAGTGSGGTISKIFITGVSPVTMDDVTSGFNIGTNITTDRDFNEMAGFTERELCEMLDYYGISNEIIEIMRVWYNNYLFSKYRETRMYNSDMALYFIREYMKNNSLPEEMIAYNIRTDYEKLKYLIIVDQQGKLRVNGNFEKIKIILEEGEIKSNIMRSFSAKRIIDTENFISLLYYLGLLTMKDMELGMTNLIIPNETIRRIYYEYIRKAYEDTDIFRVDMYRLSLLFRDVAYYGKMEELLKYLSDELKKQTGVRDYIEGERVVQNFFRVYFNVSNYYITDSEPELNKGYADIILVPNIHQFPDIKYSYLIEMKYMARKKYRKAEMEKKVKEAGEKLREYHEGLKGKMGNTEVIKIIMVFSGWELKYMGREEGSPLQSCKDKKH